MFMYDKNDKEERVQVALYKKTLTLTEHVA